MNAPPTPMSTNVPVHRTLTLRTLLAVASGSAALFAANEPPDPGAKPNGPDLKFKENLVWNDFSYPFGVQAIDLDGDACWI